jgi:hypothetical protein
VLIAAKAGWDKGSLPDFMRGKRQNIELVFGVLKEHLQLEDLGARTPKGLVSRILQRLLAYTAVRYFNFLEGRPGWRLAHLDH